MSEKGEPRKAHPGLATIYAHWMLYLPFTAERHGYALAVHGSLATDLDLIAVPWTEDATGPQELAEAVAEAVHGKIVSPGTEKPHGRLAYTICIGPEFTGPHVDLSVMPRKERGG